MKYLHGELAYSPLQLLCLFLQCKSWWWPLCCLFLHLVWMLPLVYWFHPLAEILLPSAARYRHTDKHCPLAASPTNNQTVEIHRTGLSRLFVRPSAHLSTSLPAGWFVCKSVCLSICLLVHHPVCLPTASVSLCIPVNRFIDPVWLSARLPTHPSICLVCLPVH